jgi:hypothetical protein
MGTGEVHTGFWWEKRKIGRPRRTWKDNIKLDLRKVG